MQRDRLRLRFTATYVFLVLTLSLVLPVGVHAGTQDRLTFKRIPTQFIAALADPQARSGKGAQTWGLWRRDPGPRGVWLSAYNVLKARNGIGPGQWKFDGEDWWLDENGLIMERPDFPVPPGQYLVTGDREVTTVLTIHPKDQNGEQRWELANGAKMFDVTHLPCRSARYTPAGIGGVCSPESAKQTAFPVKPGAEMPQVEGCKKQDYAVLFIVGVAVNSNP